MNPMAKWTLLNQTKTHTQARHLIVEALTFYIYQNQGDYKERRWPPEHGGAGSRRDALAKVFPHHLVMIFSDKDKELMMCMPCQLFNRAEIVVGVHGAGLTNAVFTDGHNG